MKRDRLLEQAARTLVCHMQHQYYEQYVAEALGRHPGFCTVCGGKLTENPRPLPSPNRTGQRI
jgi:hypothetical protein